MTVTSENGQIQTKKQAESTVQQLLSNDSVKEALAQMLPNNLDVARFTRIAMTSLRNSPKLLQCNPSSFLTALLQSAALGLEPNTPMGHAYLIPYGKECTLVVGYEGYIDLGYRSGVVTSIHANVVRDGDDFEWGEGSEPFIRHTPKTTPQSYTSGQTTYLSGRDTTHAYAIARLLGGGHVQVVMMKAEIDAIKSRSRAAHDGPWVTDPVAMQKKTAIRALRKYMPMSPQARSFHMAAGIDEQAEAGMSQVFEIDPAMFEITKTDTAPAEPTDGEAPPVEHGRCPVHIGSDGYLSAWMLNKHGYSHRIIDGDGYCNPSKLVLELTTAAGVIEETNPWLKQKFGITRSGVEPRHLVEIIEWIASMGEVEAPELEQTVVTEGEVWPE